MTAHAVLEGRVTMAIFRRTIMKPTLLGVTVAAMVGISNPVAAQDDDYVTYNVRPGDTLISINERWMTGRNAVREVARINGIRNPRRIPIGTSLRIPRRLLQTRTDYLTIYEVTGPVTIRDANGTRRPERNQQVGAGSIIQTEAGGFISFSVPGSRGNITLPSNTRVRLDRANIYEYGGLRDIDFEVENGRGSMRVPALESQERFRSRTPVAVTAVRGTEYRVGYLEDTGVNLTEVTEGLVGVDNEAVSEQAGAGWGMAVREQGLDELTQLLPEPELDIAPVITSETVSFAFTLPEGAVGARTQLARDATFLELIAEDISDDGTARFESADIPDARYFVRTRAISPSGIEGLDASGNFRRKLLTTDASVEESPIAGGYRFAWRSAGEGITHAVFQLWREGERGSPLYDEIAPPGESIVLTGLEPGTYVWRIGVLQAFDEQDEVVAPANRGSQLLYVWGSEQPLLVAPE